MSSFKLELCDTIFWDQNLTWHTDLPILSPCFADTFLVWLTAGVFAVCLVSELIRSERVSTRANRSQHQYPKPVYNPIRWNNFNRLRILITLMLGALKFCEFFAITFDQIIRQPSPLVGDTVTDSQTNSTASLQFQQESAGHTTKIVVLSSILAPLIQSASHFLLVLIYNIQRRAGLHTSAMVWFYLLIGLSCECMVFGSIISTADEILTDVASILKLVHLPLLLLLFLFECNGDTANLSDRPAKDQSQLDGELEMQVEEFGVVDDLTDGEKDVDTRPDSPELKASFFSHLTFWWFNEFLLFGLKHTLSLNDLWKTLSRDKSNVIVPVFRNAWINNNRSPGANGAPDPKLKGSAKKPKSSYLLTNGIHQTSNNIIRVLGKLFWAPLLAAASLKFLQDCLQYSSPLILKKLLQFMSAPETEPQWHGLLYALLLLLVPTIQSILLGAYFIRMQVIGLHVRTMIIGSIYRKAMVLSGSSRIQSTTGEIVNLMSVDSQRFQDLLLYLNLMWSAPFQIIMSVFLLYQELGWSVFVGMICMILLLPANAYLAKCIKYSQVKLMRTKDERIKQINELLNGMRVVKLYAWENSFMASLFNFRSRELEYLRKILMLDSMQTFLWQTSPFLVALVTFSVYVSVDSANQLTAERAFVSISLFNLLRFPLSMLPTMVTSFVLTLVSAKRLNRFFNSDELARYVSHRDTPEAILIEHGTVSWSSEPPQEKDDPTNGIKQISLQQQGPPPVLKDIELKVDRGAFVAVVGKVASGKSSLLAAILGELHLISGRFNVSDSLKVAYVPQQAWIQNMSVRQNVLFGADYDHGRYRQVIEACALDPDLTTIPGGDEAEIGEKGINLSGGQKQRISLARASYSDADLHLLDDPLSALDAQVARHVFEKVLSSKTGLLAGKTRLLATNSLFVLPHVDYVYVLDGGRVVESGTYDQLTSGSASGYLYEIMRQYGGGGSSHSSQQPSPSGTTISTKTVAVDVETKTEAAGSSSSKDTIKPDVRLLATPIPEADLDADTEAVAIVGTLKSIDTPPTAVAAAPVSSGRLIESERMELNSVNMGVYLSYFRAVSILWLTIVLFSLVASAAFSVATNLWLSIWTKDSQQPETANDANLRQTRLIVYSALGGLQCLSVLSGTMSLARGSVRASLNLHRSLLERVLHSPMFFFDTTPIGRIVNRFAKDIDVLDSTIPGTFRSWLNCLLSVLSTIFIICFSFPTFLLIVAPLGALYYLIQRVFIVTTRQLKRLESTTRSPIYSHFGETLAGISSIRAYGSIRRSVATSDRLVDQNQSCSYPNVVANRWLSVRLELFGNLVTSLAALFSVYNKGSIDGGLAGLVVSSSLSITQTLSWLVRMTSDWETNIVSIERILEYMSNPQEDAWIKPDFRPPPGWPQKGAIQVNEYATRYRKDTELVLSDIRLDVKAGEKLGVVGRTGSGKSSLSLALFRILEPASGQIYIDGLDINQIGLHDLRSKLTIIPQDPVLFSGTLRFNLDPLGIHTDGEIWRSLELAHLAETVRSLQSRLGHQVSEFGENFSLGQRQLICLARAILRKSKILVLDEATASVDLETDSIVQKTIRQVFSDCTIITIAHRLHTILDSDRILVLERGRLLELDTPQRLMGRPDSAFGRLAGKLFNDSRGRLDSQIQHPSEPGES